MSAFVDYKTTIRDRIWALLGANTKWLAAVKAGNQLKPETRDGWIRAFVRPDNPGTLPWIMVQVYRQVNSAWDGINTFDVENSDFNDTQDELGNPKATGSGTVDWRFDVRITVMDRVAETDEEDDVVGLTQIVLLAAGADLGLSSFVFSVGPFTAEEDELYSDRKGSMRVRTVMTFPVLCKFEMRDLVAQAT